MSDQKKKELDPAYVENIQERLNNLTPLQNLIAALGAPHVPHGSSWGFDKDLNDNNMSFNEVVTQIKADPELSKHLIPFQVRGGGLIDVLSLDYALQTFREVVGPQIVDDKMIMGARQARDEALAELVKFCQEGKEGIVGFFNTNKTSTITIKGQTAPCFRLNVKDFLGVLNNFGYKVETSAGTKATAGEAFSGVVKFMSELQKAPSSNAVLVKVSKK